MEKSRIKIKRLYPEAIIPEYKTPGASGRDLHVLYHLTDVNNNPVIEWDEYMVLPGRTITFFTGIAFEIPEHLEGQIRPRSGVSKDGIHITGTIDSDYRGDVGIIVTNASCFPYTVKKGYRIAQIVFCPVARPELEDVSDGELSETKRGEGGFGHTGLFNIPDQFFAGKWTAGKWTAGKPTYLTVHEDGTLSATSD